MSERWIGQMRKGVAELCVLAVLTPGEAYGYEILKKIRETQSLALGESTLYLLLARLLKEEFVACRTAPSEKGPARRYFHLTAKGRKRLADMSAFWKGFSNDVDRLITESEARDD